MQTKQHFITNLSPNLSPQTICTQPDPRILLNFLTRSDPTGPTGRVKYRATLLQRMNVLKRVTPDESDKLINTARQRRNN